MRTASPALIALLATGEFVMADLYTITLASGSVVRWSGADKEIEYGGNTWVLGPGMKRGSISHRRGVQVSTLEMKILAKETDLIGGVPIIPFASANGFDGATVLLERAFMPTWADPVTGTLIDFSGVVTSIKDIGPLEVPLSVSSWMVRLNTNIGPDLYQPACLNTLFDDNCALNRASFAQTGAIDGTSTQTVLDTNLGAASGYYDQGKIIFTSGANNGLIRAIKSQVGGVVTINLPLPTAPSVADTFTAYPGCDLLKATCSGKFSNLIHFRGQPYVPVAETAIP